MHKREKTPEKREPRNLKKSSSTPRPSEKEDTGASRREKRPHPVPHPDPCCSTTTIHNRAVQSTSRSEKPRPHRADFNAVPPPPLYVMSKGKEKMSTSKQFRWLPPMHEMMLRILAQENAKGNKPSSTFKAGSFSLVAKEISAQFGVECHPSYVENRMWTLRIMWSTIEKLRKRSGFNWDDNLKMITCDAKTY
nr:hypothetical protein CFP56_22095 [Quercus suber]